MGVINIKNDFFQNPTINVLKRSLSATSLRHKAISNNIANVNTPNYKRQLVKFEEELAKSLVKSNRIPLSKTNSLHFPQKQIDITPRTEIDNNSTLRTDGNNVDVDLELAMLAENTLRFNVLSQAISKKYSLLRSVIQGGK